MPLDIQAVTQAKVTEFILAQLARQKTPGLVAELCDALLYQRFVDYVIPIHAATIRPAPLFPPITGKHELRPFGPVRRISKNRDLLGRGILRLRAA
jgi:hypothetical protein